MSRTDMPRAYIATIFSSKPWKRRRCLGTICGSNEPARSRGCSIRTEPCSECTVFSLKPLRALPAPPERRLTALVAEMLRQLGVHRPLDQPLRQTLKQPVRAGDLLRRARAGEQLVDQLVRQLRWLERIVIRAGVDRRQSPIGELLRQIGLPFSRPAARNFRAADTTQVRPCLHRESDRPQSWRPEQIRSRARPALVQQVG